MYFFTADEHYGHGMINLAKYERFVAENRALVNLLTSKRAELEGRITKLQNVGKDLSEALDVMNAVSILCQEQFKGVVEGIVTDALKFVYGETYSFEMDSEIKRNQPEIVFYVVIDGHRYSIRNDDIGGGVIDVVAFALRVTLWALQDQQTDNVMILDEPLKNLDVNRLVLMGDMIKKISQDLGLQFIVVTHETQLAEAADASWFVTKSKNVSTVEQNTR